MGKNGASIRQRVERQGKEAYDRVMKMIGQALSSLKTLSVGYYTADIERNEDQAFVGARYRDRCGNPGEDWVAASQGPQEYIDYESDLYLEIDADSIEVYLDE